MRRFVTDEERILWVLEDAETWMRQADIIKRAKMAPAACIAALKGLVRSGELEWSKLYRGRAHGSGRPAYLYRRTAA